MVPTKQDYGHPDYHESRHSPTASDLIQELSVRKRGYRHCLKIFRRKHHDEKQGKGGEKSNGECDIPAPSNQQLLELQIGVF